MWDGNDVLLPINFAEAPAAPDPSSIYSGNQVIVVETDGTTFSNDDPWKCLTCGVPAANKPGISSGVDHPQAFHDGIRALIGTNILDCSLYLIISDSCTSGATRIYPIRWNTSAAGSGPGGSMRELRLNPDDVHLGWNDLVFASTGMEEFAFMGRLVFNNSPTTGTPLVSRYEFSGVWEMLDTSDPQMTGPMITVDSSDPTQLRSDPPAGGHRRVPGLSSDGKSAIGIGSQDSWNTDLFATDLQTGMSTRLTRDPAYTDPMQTSPDDNWTAVMDGRVDNRMYFAGAMPDVPPLTDLANVGDRQPLQQRQPSVLRALPHRPLRRPRDYHGQQINGGGDTTPGTGGISDPLWNGRANPAWSPDGTNIVYWQALVTSPACGPANPSVPTCLTSTEPGGRRTRLMIAKLTSRTALSIASPHPFRIPSRGEPNTTPVTPSRPDPTFLVVPTPSTARCSAQLRS